MSYTDPNWGTAAASSIDNASAIYATGTANKKTREWNEKMQALQRQQAIEDWNRQNEYNHPSAQMARLREAGLNPHLVYGKGADNTSAPVRSTESKSLNYGVPNLTRATDVLAQNNNLALGKAQVDNLRVQQTVAAQDAILKSMQTSQIAANTAKTKQETSQAASLFTGSMEAQKLMLQKTAQDIFLASEANRRADTQQTQQLLIGSQSLRESAERILKSKAERENLGIQGQKTASEIENLLNSYELQQMDIKMRKDGITPSDPYYIRWLQNFLNKPGTKFEGAKEKDPNKFMHGR